MVIISNKKVRIAFYCLHQRLITGLAIWILEKQSYNSRYSPGYQETSKAKTKQQGSLFENEAAGIVAYGRK